MEDKKSYIMALKRFVDDRGALDQIFNKDLPFNVVRAYYITTNRGVIRGMHGHKVEWKALYATKGALKVVVTDMQIATSSTFTLSENLPQMLIVPNNWYHGFAALSEEAQILILSSLTLDESKKDDYRISPHDHESLIKAFKVVDR